ncbi:metal-dependent hydrolase [Arenimonas sp.]|uniref:metal-dependent hydrolase n=1 Tax=Arenimonas sp. TaxID=1872635 RepID=UPI0039E72366
MDSITHLFLGGAVAAAIAPAKYRRTALVFGAIVNSLPDLDVLPLLLSDDPVVRMTWHRAATHSLLLLPFAALAIWWLLKRYWTPVREQPRRWFWLILACLLAHPLTDAFTVYGTQLFWPLPVAPTMGGSVFIIDPLFTLPLFIGCVVAFFARAKPLAGHALNLGLFLAVAYLGWSLVAKSQVERVVAPSLALAGLDGAPHFVTPMPFNTLLWRVVAMTPAGFVEGEYSLVADGGAPIRFRHHPSDVAVLAQVKDFPAVRELAWFNHGFMKAEVFNGQVVLSDLRMGSEPDYSFRFAVAQHDTQRWYAIPPQQLEWPWAARERLPAIWRRIWHADEATREEFE